MIDDDLRDQVWSLANEAKRLSAELRSVSLSL